ncbi:sensor domain-containing diguanylate cyclase [Desulfosarcina sp. OttesenSCG-928-G17]|nr:sensor domain-containing diguanylate cyclase [Desulfosarcina sp. OttesenSCG-928-G17]
MDEPRDEIDTLKAENQALHHPMAELEAIEKRCKQAEAALASLKAQNRLLGDSAPLGIFTVDRNGHLSGINRRMQAIFPPMAAALPGGLNLFDDPDMAALEIVADIQRCMVLRKELTVDHPYTDATDNTIYLRYYLSPIAESDAAPTGVVAFVEDATDLKRTEEALRDSEKRFRRLFQSAPIALVEWDVSPLKDHLENLRESGVTDFSHYLEEHPDQVPYCWSLIQTVNYNPAFLSLMGISDRTPPTDAFLPIDTKDVLNVARDVILLAAAGKAAVEREATIITTNGERKVVLGKSLVASGYEDTLGRVVIALIDISQRKEAEAALRASQRRFQEQAFRDGLTGLYNQRYLYQSLATWIERSKAENKPLSVIFMDLDRFKQVVDTYGHLNGSRTIQKVAQTIAHCLEEPAYAVAYAGDEFVVILPGMGSEEALQKAREIHSQIGNTVYTLNQGIEVSVQASLGIATFPDHAADLNGLIAAADQVLFKVKATGKNAIALYQPE